MYIVVAIISLVLTLSYQAFSQEPTVIVGKVLGYDGRPLLQADILWKEGPYTTESSRITANKDGSFVLVTYCMGGLKVSFSGVGHSSMEHMFLAQGKDTIRVKVQLPTLRYKESFDSVKVIGDFNEFSFDSAIPMQKLGNGTYKVTVESDVDTLGYQLINVAKAIPGHLIRSLNGITADHYRYEEDGDYISIVNVDSGKATIIFDPGKLPPQQQPGYVHVEDPDSTNILFADLYRQMLANRKLPEMEELQRETLVKLSKQISAEKNVFVRQMLLLSYLDLPAPRRMKDSAIGRRIVEEVPVSSPLWALNGNWVYAALFLAGEHKYEEYQQYVEEFITAHPDTNLRAYLLRLSIRGAERENRKEYAERYYAMLLNLYGNTYDAGFVRAQYGKDGKVTIGKKIPYFELRLLDDTATVLTPDSLRGQIYLIDFWAVWCAPCIEEMENLHSVYEKFRAKGFRILSISLDNSPKIVEGFRAHLWKMPWYNAIDTSGMYGELAKHFDIFGLPKPILVGADGNVVAIEGALRGGNLDVILSKLFEADVNK